jgi:hypothetical protein
MEHGDLMRRGLRRGAFAIAAALLLLAPSSAVAEVNAEFSVSPSSPVSGEVVTFTSTSSSDEAPITSEVWDLDNDGAFDDASGRTASRSFPSPGTYRVRLRATDGQGDSETASRNITVRNSPPTASFTYEPSPPLRGEVVTLNSNSSDVDGTIVSHAWDLDNDGAFDDATDSITTRVFPEAGSYSVGLRVRDNAGESSTTVISIPVVASRQPLQASFMTPFPVVRIQGRATRAGARITRLTVQAPAGVRLRVTCRGKRRGCPKRRTVNRTVQARSDGRTPITRIRRFERRLRAGAVIRVYVTADGVIGKYSRFVVRRRRAPARRDLCLLPGSMQPARCPGG